MVVCQHHYQTVDTDSFTRGRSHPVAKRSDEVKIHMHRLFIPRGLLGIRLCLEAFELIERVIELIEAVGDLLACHEELETFRDLRVLVTSS